tara:strand:- start:761 stop:1480 length:720 start_codon:yes stop_codon:yes gene_type:complete
MKRAKTNCIILESEKIACIIGTGRSGTGFIAKALGKAGRDIGHEAMGKDGISSWCLVADDIEPPYGLSWSRVKNLDAVIGHQVRHPVDSILSLLTMNKRSEAFIRNSGIGDFSKCRKKTEWAMIHWLTWNQRAYDKASFHWTLDNAETGFMPMLDSLSWGINQRKWTQSIQAAGKIENAAKSRVQFKKMARMSPKVLLSRIKHAYFPRESSWQTLADVDAVLAQEIKLFYTTLASGGLD